MTAPELVIFDLDGTLIDSAPGIVACLEAAFAEVAPGHTLPPLRPFIGPPVARMIPAIAPHLPPAAHTAVLASFRRRYDEDGCDEVLLLPGAIDALTSLRTASIPTALATYKPLAPTTRILRRTQLAPFLVAVRCVDGPDGPFETKAQMLTSICVQLGASPAGTVYVGDTRMDEEAADAAGTGFYGLWPPAGFGEHGSGTVADLVARLLSGRGPRRTPE